MKFTEIVSSSQKELFVAQLEHMILSGQLTVGEKLPNERDLAQQMKISRSIINSGVQELQHRALIRIVPRHGAYVEDFILNGNIYTLMSIIGNKGIDFNKATLRYFIDFRRDIEIICAYEATKHRTMDDLDIFNRKLKYIQKSVGTDAFVEAALSFHQQIFISTHNLVYSLLYNIFYDISSTLTSILYFRLDASFIIKNLDDILDSIKAKNPELAREKMKEYIDSWYLLFKEYFQF